MSEITYISLSKSITMFLSFMLIVRTLYTFYIETSLWTRSKKLLLKSVLLKKYCAISARCNTPSLKNLHTIYSSLTRVKHIAKSLILVTCFVQKIKSNPKYQKCIGLDFPAYTLC